MVLDPHKSRLMAVSFNHQTDHTRIELERLTASQHKTFPSEEEFIRCKKEYPDFPQIALYPKIKELPEEEMAKATKYGIATQRSGRFEDVSAYSNVYTYNQQLRFGPVYVRPRPRQT